MALTWKKFAILVVVVATGSVVVLLGLPARKTTAPPEPAVAQTAPPAPALVIPPVTAPIAPTSAKPRTVAPAVTPKGSPESVDAPAAPSRSEASLMGQLRALSGSDPALSLRLAREGNVQFKESQDAPERAWIIVKSLMNMERTEEARAEAAIMLQKYPGTSWANDVHRHMFVNPPGHPLERGYGKKTELE